MVWTFSDPLIPLVNEKEFFAKELSQQLKQKRNDKQAEKKSKAGVVSKNVIAIC